MRRSSLAVIELVAFGALAMGCTEDVDSKNIRTAGMYANFKATARADGETELRAELRVGGRNGTYVQLSPGDELIGFSGVGATAETHELDHHEGAFNAHHYSADFDGIAANQLFAIQFNREDDESAPSSSTNLPAPFEITAPQANLEVSRAADLVVTWSPVSDDVTSSMEVDVDSDCLFPVDTQEPRTDTGSVTFATGELEATQSHETETCEATITVRRTRPGSIDPAFGEGGRFDGIQERTIKFRTTP